MEEITIGHLQSGLNAKKMRVFALRKKSYVKNTSTTLIPAYFFTLNKMVRVTLSKKKNFIS